MRFDEFVAASGLAVLPIDECAGCEVRVELPLGWEPFDTAAGLGVWVCRSDPRADQFCANAVLTMHCVDAALDCGDVFTMLADQQLQLVPGCRETGRYLTQAVEGAGVAGTLALEFAHELGPLDSICQSRIVAMDQKTLIVQLTTSVLRDSPVVRQPVRLTVRTDVMSDDESGDQNRLVPVKREAGCDSGQ